MPRPKTRPATPEPKATQQRLRILRNAHKGVDSVVVHLCDHIISQLGNIAKFTKAGETAKAAHVKAKVQISMLRLAERLAKRSTGWE